jgi:hypothetical protein
VRILPRFTITADELAAFTQAAREELVALGELA